MLYLARPFVNFWGREMYHYVEVKDLFLKSKILHTLTNQLSMIYKKAMHARCYLAMIPR